MQAIDHLKCPLCNSKTIWKDGLRYTKDGEVQRYICRNCGYRFSDPNCKQTELSMVQIRLDIFRKFRRSD